MGIVSVKQRIYLGECKNEKQFNPIINYFNKNKSVIINEINTFKYIDEKERNKMVKYIEEFFETINSDKFYKRHILKNCKQIKKVNQVSK